jgi:hypothetical protein
MKEEKRLVPDLIPLLADKELAVARAAHVVLRDLTGRDFGPPADANPAARAKAVERWRAWYIKQGNP